MNVPSMNEFARYLRSFAPWESCGVAEIPCHCPIAKWLNNVYPFNGPIAVDLDTIKIGIDEIDAPLWVFEVARRIDASADCTGAEITASQAMAIVNYVIGEIGDE